MTSKVKLSVPAVSAALTAARAVYTEQNPRSLVQHRLAANVMPGGNTRSVLFSEPFPIALGSAAGCRVTSLDGRTYVDFLGEYTAGLYGHSDPTLRAAIVEALDHGWVLGGHTQKEAELARLICERFESIEMLRFTNSGTEANLYAISTARAVTNRKKVIVFEGAYHGGVFAFGAARSPLIAPFDFIVAPFNDIAGTRALLEAHGGDIACIVVEPMQGSGGCIPADYDFLRELRQWATRDGALLILDEVMTSRLSMGGMQELCDLSPDLTTLGKYIGGGFSFGAFGGRADILQRFNPLQLGFIAHAGTFNNNVFTMSAGVAGLRDIYTAEAVRRLNDLGDRTRERLNEVAQLASFPMQFTGLGSMMNVHMQSGPIRSVRDLAGSDQALRELFYFDMLQHGIWPARRGMFNISLPMTETECDLLVKSVDAFVRSRSALAN